MKFQISLPKHLVLSFVLIVLFLPATAPRSLAEETGAPDGNPALSGVESTPPRVTEAPAKENPENGAVESPSVSVEELKPVDEKNTAGTAGKDGNGPGTGPGTGGEQSPAGQVQQGPGEEISPPAESTGPDAGKVVNEGSPSMEVTPPSVTEAPAKENPGNGAVESPSVPVEELKPVDEKNTAETAGKDINGPVTGPGTVEEQSPAGQVQQNPGEEISPPAESTGPDAGKGMQGSGEGVHEDIKNPGTAPSESGSVPSDQVSGPVLKESGPSESPGPDQAPGEDMRKMARAGEGETIALLPFENLTDERKAPALVMPLVREQLEKMGLHVVYGKDLKEFMIKNRIRVTGYVSAKTAGLLRKEFGARAVLVGSVLTFSNQDGPKIGIAARLIDTASCAILWAGFKSEAGVDFAGILGLGRIDTMDGLARKIVPDLFSPFELDSGGNDGRYRVAVMPFRNVSETKNAGIAAMYIFLSELFSSDYFMPVEYGDIREFVVSHDIRALGELDYQSLDEIARISHVDGVILGSVDEYLYDSGTSPVPEVSISARLVDVTGKKILWYDSERRSGDDATIVFDWGKIRSADELARKIILKLVNRMETVK